MTRLNYQDFLARAEAPKNLPYLGGSFVYRANGTPLRITSEVKPGWYAFEVTGRRARAIEPIEPGLELFSLPFVRGYLYKHWVQMGEHEWRVVKDDAKTDIVELVPPDEPPIFSPVRAKRWGPHLLFVDLTFESGIEDLCRKAFDETGKLGDEKGIPSALRAAVGYAAINQVAQRLVIPAAPAEVRKQILTLGAKSVQTEIFLRNLMHQRGRGLALHPPPYVTPGQRFVTTEDQVQEILRAAGAELVRTRAMLGDSIEVVYKVDGERIVSIVEAATFRIRDAGICLEDHATRERGDTRLTLASIPGVIREAINDDKLVILRRTY